MNLHADLTDRQTSVLVCAAQGYNHREIAALLDISPQTARHHLQAVHEKLKARNTAHAVAIALTQHIIQIGGD